jgi:hypothetical protein
MILVLYKQTQQQTYISKGGEGEEEDASFFHGLDNCIHVALQ